MLLISSAVDHCFRSRTVDSSTDQALALHVAEQGLISSGLRCKKAAIYHHTLPQVLGL